MSHFAPLYRFATGLYYFCVNHYIDALEGTTELDGPPLVLSADSRQVVIIVNPKAGARSHPTIAFRAALSISCETRD